MSDDRILRQWQLLQAIAAGGGQASIKSLIDQSGMSDKTVRRDVALLQRVFPVIEQTGEFGRKTFALDSAQVPRVDLRYDESLALFYCRQSLLPLAGTFFWKSAESAFAKIRAALGPPALAYLKRMQGRLHQTHSGPAYADKAEQIDRLIVAAEDCVVAFIAYHSSRSTEPLSYPVEPYGLVEHRGSLYLVGHSQQHHEVRHWKVDRIETVELTKFPFRRPDDFDLQDHLADSFGVYQGSELVRVRVRFAPAAARYVREKRMHPSQRVTDQAGGAILAEWTLSSLVEVKSYVLSFGAAAEVLEPQELRSEVLAQLQAAAAQYQTPEQRPGRKKPKPQTQRLSASTK